MHTVLDSDGARPTESRRKIRKQMGKYGDSIEFAEGEVIMVRKAYFENGFQGSQIDEKGGKVCRGRNIVLATGTRDVFPDIKGYAENWPYPALKEAMDAAQSTGYIFDERIIIELTRTPNEQKKVMVDGLGMEIIRTMFGSYFKMNEPFGETSVKSCFVAGDTGTPMTQITIAVAHGVAVADGVSAQLCAEEGERVLTRDKNVSIDEVDVAEKHTTQCMK
ncbi:hypothetical protein HO133_003499 [Letharia lupina]|uniref:FAD/NAD(P)-binding domain-containing protein n=1 Tax=Letharia lupina TaxID=560253 RepID=A0A8H6CBB9_9LECA|nr:uncharacterized protein HO133_003499 [Letharia lupina]KAF6220367.1 hypothetical protein HO133_003499 [Letharia lupina]